MKQSGNGGQGQAHCIKRNSKSFFMCRTASWRSASKLESTLLATIPLFPQNFSISIYRAGMTLGAVGICFHVVLLGEAITCLHYIVNTLKNLVYYRAPSAMRVEIRYCSVPAIVLVRHYGPVPIAVRRFALRKKLPMHKKSSVVPARSFRSAASILPCALFAAGHRAKLRHQAPVSKNIMRFLCQLEAMTPKTILFFCAMSAIQHGTKPIRKYRVS